MTTVSISATIFLSRLRGGELAGAATAAGIAFLSRLRGGELFN